MAIQRAGVDVLAAADGKVLRVRDGVADFLGMDDGSPLLEWKYDQRKAAAFGVEIKIEEVDL